MPRLVNGSGTVAGKNSEIEKIISEILGVAPRYVPDYDRLTINAQDRVQSRIDQNNAPKAMVERYAHQMAEFDFPAIVVTSDGIKVDGNTRDKAWALRNQRYVPAFVVPIEWGTADAATQDKLLYLSELLNNMNGLPLNEEERIKMVGTMMRQGLSDEEIRGKVGIKAETIAKIRRQFLATSRLQQVGLDANTLGFSERTLEAFGRPKALQLDDASFRGVAELSREADLRANEIKALVTSLIEAGSDELRRDRLARERQAREPQITARAHGQAVPNLAGRLRGALKMLPANPTAAFIEHNREVVDEYLELIARAIDILREIQATHPRPVAPAAAAAAATATTAVRPSVS